MTVSAAPATSTLDPKEYVFGETLRRWMTDAFEDVQRYVTSPAFREMYREFLALPGFAERDAFVRQNLLDPVALARRGLTPPDGIIVQRSAFGDRRPTVFCVVKYLPDGVRKITVTFDDKSDPAGR